MDIKKLSTWQCVYVSRNFVPIDLVTGSFPADNICLI